MSEPAAPYLFVSYASDDRERVLSIVERLEEAGIGIWIDREGIQGGETYAQAIGAAIKDASALLLMCSRASLASRNVHQEIALAWKYERPYLPLLLEPSTVPPELEYWLEGVQWIDVLDLRPEEWLPKVLAALGHLGIRARAHSAGRRRPAEPKSPASPSEVETPTPPGDVTVSSRDAAIRLLGRFHVEIGGRPIAPDAWRLRKAAQLVKLLALTPGHRLHRDQIAELLWPDLDPDAAQRNFHQVLFAARQILEPGRTARSATVLPLRQQMLALQPAGTLWVDIEAFQAAAEAAKGSTDPAAVEAALALYGGDLLPDELYEDWAAVPREQLRETYLRLLGDLARLHEERGEFERAIGAWERLVAADPAREEAYAGLMRAYALAGRRQQALRQYQRLRAVLARELEVEPAPETTALYQRILAGRFPSEAEQRPTPAAPRSSPGAAPVVPAPTPAPAAVPAQAPIPPLELVAASNGFVDRDRELAVLQRNLEEMLGGRGRAVLISGDPGIGKSRLVEELVRYAERLGVRTAWGRCYEGEGAPAFWPWLQIVRHELDGEAAESREDLGANAAAIAQIVPEIHSLLPGLEDLTSLDPAQARFRLFDAVTAFLKRRAARRPLLLVLDDLHWADDSSLRLLEFLAADIDSSRLLIVGTYRQAEVGARGPLAQTLARLSRLPAGERLRLTGLDEPSVASFSELALGRPVSPELVATVYRRSEGNPLYIRELVRLVRDEDRLAEAWSGDWLEVTLPPQIQDVINLRLLRLPPACLDLLTIAAVIGREFDLGLVARVAAVSTAAALERLDDAMRAGIVEELAGVPGCLRFTHVLIPETLYAGLTAARRAGLHARVGQALEALHAADPSPPLADLAHHFFLAAAVGEAERAIDYLLRAGEQAMAQVAYAEAAAQFQRAVDLLERFFPDRRAVLADTLLELGRAQMAAGDAEVARASMLRSIGVAREIGDIQRQATAASELMDVALAFTVDDFNVLQMVFNNMPAEDSALRARIMSRLALLMTLPGFELQPELTGRDAVQLATEALAMARRIDVPAIIAEALRTAYDVLTAYHEVDKRLNLATEMLSLAERTGSPQLALVARSLRLIAFLLSGRVDEADQEIDAYEAVAKTYQLPINLWSVTTKKAMRAYMRGDLQASESLMERARVIGLRADPEMSPVTYSWQSFFLRREQDRLSELEGTLVAEADIHRNDWSASFWQGLLAVMFADAGRVEQASDVIAALVSPGTGEILSSTVSTFRLALLALLSDACATVGCEAHAPILLAAMEPHVDLYISPGNNPIFLGPVSHYLGRLYAAMGERDKAEAQFRAALDAEIRTRTPIPQAYTLCAYAALVAEFGDRPRDVRRLLDAATDLADRFELPRARRVALSLRKSLITCHSP